MRNDRNIRGISIHDVKSLLIVKPSSLGDILHTFPLANALRAANATLSIDWVANGEFVSLIRRHPAVRHVWEFPRRDFGKSDFFRKMQILSQSFTSHSYDVVLDAQGLLRSALISRFAVRFGRSGHVIGFDNAREGATLLYHQTVHIPESSGHPFHAVPRNLLFLNALGHTSSLAERQVPLCYGPTEKEAIDHLLSEYGLKPKDPFVAIHPGARRNSKKWPSIYFSELIRLMDADKCPQALLLGDKGEAALLEEVETRADLAVPRLAGKIPLDLVPLFLSRASLFIGNDSGPLHMAALSGIPTLSFYGSSDPGRTGPWGSPQRNIVLREPLPCSPCGDFKKSCSHMTCQVSLTPELALDAVRSLLRHQTILAGA